MTTRKIVDSLAVTVVLMATQLLVAQAPAGAPAGATGMCNDGTYYMGAKKQGACRGHKGVKEWYGTRDSTKAAAPAESISSHSNATTPASQASSESSQSTSAEKSKVGKTPAPGGGPDKVWLNTASNVYHCPGTRYYGTTKAGSYMTEEEAKAKGARPDHGKVCK